MTYNITKHFPKKHVFRKYDFLFEWNANLIFFKENFLLVIISVENRVFFSRETLDIEHLHK